MKLVSLNKIFGATLIILFSSCNIMYVPNQINVPLMKEKGEAHINLNTSNLQASYSITNNIAVMANGFYRNTSISTFGSEIYSANRWLGEGALGYYKPIENNIIFEVFAGGGMGNINFSSPTISNVSLTPNFNANMAKGFIQPSIGFTLDYFDIALSGRFVALSFSKINTLNYSATELINLNMYNLDKTPYLFFEPALTMRFGYKWVKVQLQAIYLEKLTAEPLNYNRFQATLGVHLTFGRKFMDN